MKAKALPSQSYLKEVFDYDEESGRLIWKKIKSKSHQYKLGKVAGGLHSTGRYTVALDKVRYLHCRLVYMWYYGIDPGNQEIDHIDQNPSNDCISNLRLANHSQQSQNRCAPSNNTSGTRGVTWVKRHQRWRARITLNGSELHIGEFESKDDAIAARMAAEQMYYGEYAPG